MPRSVNCFDTSVTDGEIDADDCESDCCGAALDDPHAASNTAGMTTSTREYFTRLLCYDFNGFEG